MTKPRVVEYGIPLDVRHFKEPRRRDNVWNFAHILAVPHTRSDNPSAGPCTHVCILCAEYLSRQPNAKANAWEGALRKWGHATNAKDHMAFHHPEHEIGKAAIAQVGVRARSQIEQAHRAVQEAEQRATDTSLQPRKHQKTISACWTPSNKTVNVFLAEWFISDGTSSYIYYPGSHVTPNFTCQYSVGHPYNMLKSDRCKKFVRVATGDPRTTVLAPSTYRAMIDAQFTIFCDLVSSFLKSEFERAHNIPFLNFHHDLWTSDYGTQGVVGGSACFIDHQWRFWTIALITTVDNGSHEACRLRRLMSDRIKDLYDLDIDAMAQFTVSDTANAAKKVSRLFAESVQTDCTMHVLNLCLNYGVGLRDNTESVYLVDPVTQLARKKKRVCTPGGEFDEGRKLIIKVRALNNYFSTPQRVNRLKEIQG